MELAIDTSTAVASLALSQEGRALAELTWTPGQNHTVELWPNVEHLLGLARVGQEALGAIIVARGPGSFNGLRVGVAAAKGLAFALGLPLVGISTLEVEAYAHREGGLPLCPLHPAGRGEVAAALFQQRRGCWLRLWEEHLTTVEELASRLVGRTLFCGELSPSLTAELQGRLGNRARIVSEAARRRRAAYLAELGWAKLQAGEQDSPAALQPLYLRHPSITQPRSKGERLP